MNKSKLDVKSKDKLIERHESEVNNIENEVKKLKLENEYKIERLKVLDEEIHSLRSATQTFDDK